ncbi:hypothetical protein ACFQZE_17685 [Paenibacillus sp. GCM10027627]|uniref:hypothetical protein n=1 Tax=unclassified Paenibacillus TaxID=185978 RepID=UPI00363190CE
MRRQDGDGQTGSEFSEPRNEGRENYDMDIDRMVNEGLGGGQVTLHNGLIAESTTDTMVEKPGEELKDGNDQSQTNL